MTRFRPINCVLLSLFLWTPGWQTSAANWLTRFMWTEILSTFREKVSYKNFEPFWRNITSKIVMSFKVLVRFRHITCFFFYLCFYERQAFKSARPIGWLHVASCERKYCHLIECHISLGADFALSIVLFYHCFYERQSYKPARPIGWLGLCERKYSLLCREKVSCKNFEPFWRNITSKIAMSCKHLPRFRPITWFFYLCYYVCQAFKSARPIGWLGSCERKYGLLGAGKVLWKNCESLWRMYHLRSSSNACSWLYVAMNYCLLLAIFH